MKDNNNKKIKEMLNQIGNDWEKYKEEIEKYHIRDNFETYEQINEIHGFILDYYHFGTLINPATGEVFTLSTGIRQIRKLLENVKDEVYKQYEEDRIEEILCMIERRIKEMENEENEEE